MSECSACTAGHIGDHTQQTLDTMRAWAGIGRDRLEAAEVRNIIDNWKHDKHDRHRKAWDTNREQYTAFRHALHAASGKPEWDLYVKDVRRKIRENTKNKYETQCQQAGWYPGSSVPGFVRDPNVTNGDTEEAIREAMHKAKKAADKAAKHGKVRPLAPSKCLPPSQGVLPILSGVSCVQDSVNITFPCLNTNTSTFVHCPGSVPVVVAAG